MESYTPTGLKCLTLFSELGRLKERPKKNQGLMITLKENIDYVIIHQNNTPPHLFNDRIEVGKYIQNTIDYKSIEENLLPFPYETNCYDYRKNSKSYKSKEDCIVRYFQREEFSKCGYNRKWIYYHFKNLTDIKTCSKFE